MLNIRIHKDDPVMLEIWSKDTKGKFILWGTVHADILDEMNKEITREDIENGEYYFDIAE